MKKISINKSLFPKSFWMLTLLKLICGALFASHYVMKGFIPFAQYFITTGKNPYDYFFAQNTIVFPYPTGMLLLVSSLLSVGYLVSDSIFSNIILQLIIFRIPIIIADIVIYIILCKLLPTKENKVLWLYYASPILFYINYYHGQLDVIPTSLLILSLYLLSMKKYFVSYIALGIGLATKTHLLIALPFYAVYLIRQRMKPQSVLVFSALSLAIFIIINIPFVSIPFLSTVFNNAEQHRLFNMVLPYHYKDLTLLTAPAALLGCLYIFASNKRVNFDSLILTLGLVYTVLIALVPPMQGWFYWSIPLFTFFLIKYKDSHLISFFMMNVFFLAFFLFTKDSDIFESASISFTALRSLPNPYQFLEQWGLNAVIIQNMLFTCLQVSVAMNAYWCYRLGIFYNNLYIEKQQPFVLGVGGDSGVGKSTFTEKLTSLVGKNQLVILNGDDSHKWERQNNQWEYFTHLNPKANYLHNDVNQIYALIDGKTIERAIYNHKTGKFSRPTSIEKNQFIVFQGLHPFFLDKMRAIYDLKIFIEAEEKLRNKWKMERDIKYRGYSAAKLKRDIEKRKKDAAKFVLPQKKLADWIISYYEENGLISVKNTFSSSVPLDELVGELATIKELKIKHEYINMNLQRVYLEGKISKNTIKKIAYKLYPNLNLLINNQPDFKENTLGINQLFFINYLNFFFSNNRR
jgi:uridine kinase